MGIVDKLRQKINDAKHSVIADSSLQEERITICNGCEFLNRVRQCKKCGCFMDAKVKIIGTSCPMKKW